MENLNQFTSGQQVFSLNIKIYSAFADKSGNLNPFISSANVFFLFSSKKQDKIKYKWRNVYLSVITDNV